MIRMRFMIKLAIVAVIALLIINSGKAMPPHPDLIAKIDSGIVQPPYALSQRTAALAKGIDQPGPSVLKSSAFHKPGNANSTYNVLCVLIEFSDKAAQATATSFDTLMFVNVSGSVRHYYNEVSYANFDMVTVDLPSSLGWQMAPETYNYYCWGANGMGAYPHNSQKLCEDIIALVDGSVDFANYDNDGDGWVDAVVLVHAGPGAELTGNSNDIWSHKWGISPQSRDGKWISTYNIQGEYWYSPGDMTLGVFAHELGHAMFGLPDFYDTDYSSRGLGKWSLMASGSWNGSLGSSPAHPDAWCRIAAGFASSNNVVGNVTSQSIPNVEQNSSGSIFRLWTNGGASSEYFLIENRQKTGYDTGLPSSGLLIYHCDDNVAADNDNEWYPGHTASGHYKVALEQADNLYNLEKNQNYGDSGDPYPGSTSNVLFSAAGSPGSNSYASAATLVGVSNISASASTMTADLAVALAADVEDYTYEGTLPEQFELKQNSPNPFNPTTRISFDLLKSAEVKLVVYNLLGEEVETLISGPLAPGSHSFDWLAQGDNGESLPSGVYFYRLVAGAYTATRKMVLLK